DPKVFRDSDLQVVYTPIHGVGGVATVPILEHFGIRHTVVEEQAQFDPRFPTVKSPNPEYEEALTQAIAQANRTGADVVLATDPDCDRMGVAVRNRDGEMQLLTGNQIGVLLADYRITRMKQL